MVAERVLKALAERGVTLRRYGLSLVAEPAEALTAKLRDEIRLYKPYLLQVLPDEPILAASGPLPTRPARANVGAATTGETSNKAPAPGAVWGESSQAWLHPSGLWHYCQYTPGSARVRELRLKHAGLIRAAWRGILPPGPCPLAAGMECSHPTQAVINIEAMLCDIVRATAKDHRDLTPAETEQLEAADEAFLYLSAAWTETGWEVPATDEPQTERPAPASVHQQAFDNAA